MKRIGFRGRLFVILLFFALVPSVVLMLAWAGTLSWALPLIGAPTAWDSAAVTGARALSAARKSGVTPAAELALREHEQTLHVSLMRSKQTRFLSERLAVAALVFSLFAIGLLGFGASRVAGHFSRNLSRPLQELVGWTQHIARAEPIPDAPVSKGAPEFDVLRLRMRRMASELEQGRRAALEAERVSAMRETARQVAHELKNPLTPIRFAVERLRRDAPPALQEAVEVLEIESRRLEQLARSFAQFGRMPEGPVAPVDLGEVARYAARSSVPEHIPLEITIADELPLIDGHHDALSRAVANVMLNAVDACRGIAEGGRITVDVRPVNQNGTSAVAVAITDTGCGIPPDRLAKIWEPYVTYKPGGTGLGLAIVRQTVQAHAGEVSAESQPGQGTTIRFLFKCHPS